MVAVVLLPLRAFLGFTFAFAGLQKLANPNFFGSSPTSIRSQLVGAARTSPFHGLLVHLVGLSTPIGLLIALGELAVGLGVLTGVLTRVAALGGMLISLSLFLTVSFHSRPYYTGSDIVFLFAFTPLLLGGAGELTLYTLARNLAARSNSRRVYDYRAVPAVDEERREVLVTGGLAVAGVGLAVLAAGLGRLAGSGGASQPGPQVASPASKTPTSTSPATTARSGSGAASTTAAGSAPPGKMIGPASDVPVGGAATFQDPATGDPALVIQPSAGKFLAFDAVCPHAGCTVEFVQSQDVIGCPCHGSLFNALTGAVEQGPAASGLRPIQVAEGPGGDLYAI